MYTVSRGPTRIINTTRRDISQKLDNLEFNRDLRRKNSGSSDDSDQIIMSSPRPTFQAAVSSSKGGSRNNNGGSRHALSNTSSYSITGLHHDSPPPLTPMHVETVKYFTSTWAAIQTELSRQQSEQARQNGHDDRGTKVRVYEEKEQHPALKDFKPFELEAWWGKRLYTKLTEE